jgi:hypothetical protein
MAALQSPKLSVGVRVPEGTPIIVVDRRKNIMYNVEWKDADGVVCEKEFDGLTPAMDWAKVLNLFVTIKGNGMEVVGKFGVDSVVDGKCPDGVVYDWNKASRIGATKRR